MKLSDAEISDGLTSLDGWSRENDTIKKHFAFPTFLEAIFFINRIAPIAEAADHHPELFNVYNNVDIVLTTHDANGLTAKDFALAVQIDAIS